MRLDKHLVDNHDFEARHQAQNAIKDGHVTVDGTVVLKPAFNVTPTMEIKVLTSVNPYVSRGGLKLKKALEAFNVEFQGLNVIDIGASYGGFSDCALQAGANHVFAIDVGDNQMHPKLKEHPNITLREKTNFLSLQKADLKAVDYAIMDVSFTSSVPLIVHLKSLKDIPLIVLVKPQFESHLNRKKNIIKHPADHLKILKHYLRRLQDKNIFIHRLIPSPIKGQGGNLEFLAWIKNSQGLDISDLKAIVDAAHKEA